jgi:hypothetical protein
MKPSFSKRFYGTGIPLRSFHPGYPLAPRGVRVNLQDGRTETHITSDCGLAESVDEQYNSNKPVLRNGVHDGNDS